MKGRLILFIRTFYQVMQAALSPTLGSLSTHYHSMTAPAIALLAFPTEVICLQFTAQRGTARMLHKGKSRGET